MRPRGRARAAWRRGVGGAALAGALLCLPMVGRAEPAPSEIALARRLFTEAAGLREAGKGEEAAAKLREAIAIKETPGLRFHLAHCEEQMGRLIEAQVEYDRADALIREGHKAPDVVELLEPARASLRERIPTLLVRAPPDAREVRLIIDDQPLAPSALGTRVPLNPGAHAIVVDAAAHDPFRLEVTLKEGEDRVVEAEWKSDREAAKAAASAPVSRPARRQERPESMQDSGFGVREGLLIGEGVLTAAGVAVGVIFLVQARSDDDRVKSDLQVINGTSGKYPPRPPTRAQRSHERSDPRHHRSRRRRCGRSVSRGDMARVAKQRRHARGERAHDSRPRGCCRARHLLMRVL